MKTYEKPKIYILGSLEAFIQGVGNGNMRDLYTAVCDPSEIVINESGEHNPSHSPPLVCNYFVGQGFLVQTFKDERCKN